MRAITIKAQANGYSAVESDNFGNPLGYPQPVHVFETFDGLTEWIRQNLDKPEEMPTRAPKRLSFAEIAEKALKRAAALDETAPTPQSDIFTDAEAELKRRLDEDRKATTSDGVQFCTACTLDAGRAVPCRFPIFAK